jgi:hypothetical protein
MRLDPEGLFTLQITDMPCCSSFRYNWAARKLHKRLEQLGAVEFLPRGEADERHEDGLVSPLRSLRV